MSGLLASIAALQQAQAGGGSEAFDTLLCTRLDATLEEYVAAARQALPNETRRKPS